MIKIGTALFEACEQLERERGISKEILIDSLCDAMVAAYKKHMHIKESTNVESILDEQSGEIGVFMTKLVVQDVEELRLKLGVEKVYLLSHSFGGILAINYALKYPEHLSGIIMANTIAHFMNLNQMKEQIEYGYRLLKKDTTINETDFKKLMNEAALVRKKLSAVHLGYKYIANDVNTIVKMDSIENSYKRTSDFGMTLFMPLMDSTKVQKYPEYFKDYALLTSEIKTRALIITGKGDHAVGPDYYKNYKFKNQKVVHLNGSHMLYYENNKEFTATVCDFVKQ